MCETGTKTQYILCPVMAAKHVCPVMVAIFDCRGSFLPYHKEVRCGKILVYTYLNNHILSIHHYKYKQPHHRCQQYRIHHLDKG